MSHSCLLFQERPYHILDDSNIGERVSRSELFKKGSSERDTDVADQLALDLDKQIEVSKGYYSDSDNEEAALNSSDDGDNFYEGGRSDLNDGEVDSAESEGPENGYETGDSEELSEVDDENNLSKTKFTNDGPEHSETKKKAVQFQLSLWEKLIQLRLKLQPCLQKASMLPVPSKRAKYMSGDVAQSYRNNLIKSLQTTLDTLLDVQDSLTAYNKDLKDVITGKKNDDDEIPSDSEEEEQEVERPTRKRKQNSEHYSDFVAEHEDKFNNFRNSTISHWYEQTKVVQSKQSFLNKEVTTLNQIQHILSNRERLISRTYQNRSSTQIFGEDECEAHEYLFNDDDFYQQLLREIIDKKMGNSDSADPEAMGRQWVELQKLRVKTKKRSIDTKASKGRKIRYDLHSKLLGFMAPVSTDQLSDVRQDELFKSLFKG